MVVQYSDAIRLLDTQQSGFQVIAQIWVKIPQISHKPDPCDGDQIVNYSVFRCHLISIPLYDWTHFNQLNTRLVQYSDVYSI